MSMALGCMPVGAWAEATTPTDLPTIIATDGEAVPEPTLPSNEQEAEKTDDAPASEDSEVPDESHGDSEPAADAPASEQGESSDDNADDTPADNAQREDEQDAVLVQNISVDSDVSTALWTCIGYTVLLCFTLFKSSSVAKAKAGTH